MSVQAIFSSLSFFSLLDMGATLPELSTDAELSGDGAVLEESSLQLAQKILVSASAIFFQFL